MRQIVTGFIVATFLILAPAAHAQGGDVFIDLEVTGENKVLATLPAPTGDPTAKIPG